MKCWHGMPCKEWNLGQLPRLTSMAMMQSSLLSHPVNTAREPKSCDISSFAACAVTTRRTERYDLIEQGMIQLR